MITLLDACCAINLNHGRVLELVLGVQEHGWIIGPRVLDECTDECGGILSAAIDDGRVRELDDASIGADLYLALLAKYGLGPGETECLAAALLDSAMHVATDDRRARSIATTLFGAKRVTGSLGILRSCVQAGALQLAEALASHAAMLEAGGFLPAVDERLFIGHR